MVPRLLAYYTTRAVPFCHHINLYRLPEAHSVRVDTGTGSLPLQGGMDRILHFTLGFAGWLSVLVAMKQADIFCLRCCSGSGFG
jgi:hypothetical protein